MILSRTLYALEGNLYELHGCFNSCLLTNLFICVIFARMF